MFRQFVSARTHCATTCLLAYVCVFICMQSIKSNQIKCIILCVCMCMCVCVCDHIRESAFLMFPGYLYEALFVH